MKNLISFFFLLTVILTTLLINPASFAKKNPSNLTKETTTCKNPAVCAGILRQLIFEDGLNFKLRRALKKTEVRQSFLEHLILLPPDLFYALTALLLSFWLLFFYQKKPRHLLFGSGLILMLLLDAHYLYFREGFLYGSLNEPLKLYSAPDINSTNISHLPAGILITIRKKSKNWTQISTSHQVGWGKEASILPLN